MDYFMKSGKIRLKSRHRRYLYADEDECSVYQSKNGSGRNVLWTVEIDENGGAPVVKLKSCYGCYLTASSTPFLLGWTGKKVLQTKLVDGGSSIKWQPVKEGFAVKLKSATGSFLRANTGIPPWKDSVTHDDVVHKLSQEWLIWEVDPVGPHSIHSNSSSQKPAPLVSAFISTNEPVTDHAKDIKQKLDESPQAEESTSNSTSAAKLDSIPSCSSFTKKLFPLDESLADASPPHTEADVHSPHTPNHSGRVIYYAIADDNEEVPEDFDLEFTFDGNDLKMLKEKLKELSGIEDDIYICAKNHINNRLYPLLLQLPPNNLPMYVVVVKSSSKLASTLPGVNRKMEHDMPRY